MSDIINDVTAGYWLAMQLSPLHMKCLEIRKHYNRMRSERILDWRWADVSEWKLGITLFSIQYENSKNGIGIFKI